jgi:hypothetical protein
VNGGKKFGLILNLTKFSVYKSGCHYSEISCSTICRRNLMNDLGAEEGRGGCEDAQDGYAKGIVS